MAVKANLTNNRSDMLNSLKNRFQQNTATNTWTNKSPVPATKTPNTSIKDVINSEADTTRNMRMEKAMNLLKNKHDIRLKMASWEVSSGDKNIDKLESARSTLADYARAMYLEEAKKDRSVDLSTIEKMKDQEIIDWMTKDDPEAEQAFIDFVNNWGFVKDVYDKIMRTEEAEWAEREESWWLKNALWAAGWFIANQIAWASDLLWISDYYNNKEKERLEKYKQANTAEYEKYKNWQVSFDELKKKGISGLYNDYDEDVKNWLFRGSIEDYAKSFYDRWMERANQTAQEQAAVDWLDSTSYNPEWEWAEAWKKAAEFAEFLALPSGKMWWLKNTLLGTAEIMWIDLLNKGKNNTLQEAWEDTLSTALMTSALEWVFRVPWWLKWLKWVIWKTTPEVKQSLEKVTMNQWKAANKVADKWLSATKKQATKYIDTAAQWISKRLKGIGANLEKSREKLASIGKDKFNYNDLFSSINDSFKTFEEKWWGKNAAPEIKIDKANNMSIYNEDALSAVTDSEGTKVLDYIKNEWNAFRNQWRNENAQSVEKFMKDIKGKIDKAVEEKKIDGKSEAVLKIKEWINSAYEKLYKVADDVEKWLWKEFKEQRKQFNRTKQYENFFDKYIGLIREGNRWDKLMTQLKNLEKETDWGARWLQKWEDTLGKFFNILKKDKVVDQDLWSQLVSLLYAYSLKNRGNTKELIETIYPSIPWIEELWLNILKRKVRQSEAKAAVKQGAKNRAKQQANNEARRLEKSGYTSTIRDNIANEIWSIAWMTKEWVKKLPRAWGYYWVEETNLDY